MTSKPSIILGPKGQVRKDYSPVKFAVYMTPWKSLYFPVIVKQGRWVKPGSVPFKFGLSLDEAQEISLKLRTAWALKKGLAPHAKR